MSNNATTAMMASFERDMAHDTGCGAYSVAESGCRTSIGSGEMGVRQARCNAQTSGVEKESASKAQK